ncbi:hypothetical protein DTW90_36805 [Neorhizobium sp. P12A]|uniref:hypothetical protein n=1 Tax=Neorhizobium sp. P12A TaxID=2268027 RepID=UPI0011EBB8D3|nr:hypothetical protein [Neorhizobium sp. P12A]KAA0682506.1 hypothetical protein DTW90_36805 [Neorhizobium sp. P12A]
MGLEAIMAIRYLARDLPAEYESARRLLSTDLPMTHEEWEHLRGTRRATLQGSGFTVLDYQVDPVDYGRQCDAEHSYLGIEGLWRFAEEQGIKSAAGDPINAAPRNR